MFARAFLLLFHAMALKKVSDPTIIFKYLNGIVNVYKPSNFSVKQVKSALLHNVCKGIYFVCSVGQFAIEIFFADLNELDEQQRELKQQQILLESGGAADPILRKIHSLGIADQLPSATGAKYEIEDIRCAPVASLGFHTSGVLCKL